MARTPRVLAVILARGGSTRCPGKNSALLGDRPMIRWAALAAQAATRVTRVYVSTDRKELAEAAGVSWIRQPDEISGAAAPIENALAHALICAENQARAEKQPVAEYDYVVALQCAVPVRPAGAIDALVRSVIDSGARGGVTVVPRTPWMWNVYPQAKPTIDNPNSAVTWWNPKHYPRSQDVPRRTFEEINSIQVTPRDLVLRHRRHEFPMALLELPRWADLDIDTPDDLDQARVIWPAIQSLLSGPAGSFRTHLVRHDWRPPTTRFPLLLPWADGLAGVVIGNAPIIDRIPKETWHALQQAQGLITLGLNRICCADVCTSAGFAPTMHMVWDQWPAESRMFINQGLAKLAGRTWRICGPDSASVLEFDQVLGKAVDHFGSPTELKMAYASADAACNLLYRMGCRKIYLLGCGFKPGCSGMRCSVPWQDGPGSVGSEAWQQGQLDALKDVSKYPGLQLFSMDWDTSLITSGLMSFAWPAEVQDPFQVSHAAQAAS